MPAFRTSGSTGPAPATVYFGFVPDRLGAIVPGAQTTTNNGYSITAGGKADLVNKWTIYNPSTIGGTNVATASFGATTTAPDGSSNAQKLVEGTNNGPHACQALFPSFLAAQGGGIFTGGFKWRISLFAKRAERTRFALYISDTHGFDPNFGVQSSYTRIWVIFDVANGQVGVAPQINTQGSDTPFTPLGAEIVPFGNGWYRCSLDCIMGVGIGAGTAGAYQYAILLDAGSGAGAENSSYLGNGSSGMYFWKSTALPPRAWALNTVDFFDDFTTLNGFNFNGGTRWYNNPLRPGGTGNQDWNNPNFGAFTIPSSFFSIQSGTILKLASGQPQVNLSFMSAAQGVGSGISSAIIAYSFRPPVLLEISCAWDFPSPFDGPNSNGPTFWSTSLERLTSLVEAGPTDGGYTGSECDMFEYQAGGQGPTPFRSDFIEPALGNLDSGGIAVNGYPVWSPTYRYTNTFIVYRLGIIYQSLQSANLNNPPESSPTFWSTSGVPGSPNPSPGVDYTQQNLYQTLWLPYAPGDDVGQKIQFCNNALCVGLPLALNANAHSIYGPRTSGSVSLRGLQVADGSHYPLMFGCSTNNNAFVDFMRVTK